MLEKNRHNSESRRSWNYINQQLETQTARTAQDIKIVKGVSIICFNFTITIIITINTAPETAAAAAAMEEALGIS